MKCEKLFQTIEILDEEYLQFLTDICNIESPTEYKEGVDKVGQYISRRAAEKGWLVESQRQEVSGDCICITMNPDAPGAPVCFSGHMDTVHPLGSFGEVPVHRDDRKIYGPGVIDCKGGIAASFMAMDALEKCGFKERPVKLILQSDEENGSCNSNRTTIEYMYEKAKGCIAFLNTEPFRKKGLIVARKGIAKYKIEVRGKAAHASVCFKGASAIREAAEKIIRLEQYKDEDTITCNCGLINGGTAENTVPDSCTFTVDCRFTNEEQRKEIEKIVNKIVNTSFVEGTSSKIVSGSYRCSMDKTEANLELFEKIAKIYSENKLPKMKQIFALGGADSADLTQMGITCLDGFGTEGGGMHSLDEFAYLKSLVQSAKRLGAVAYCI